MNTSKLGPIHISGIIKPIEDFLGFGIEHMTPDEIDFQIAYDQDVILELGNKLDRILIDDRDKVGCVDDQVVPIGYFDWYPAQLLEETRMALT